MADIAFDETIIKAILVDVNHRSSEDRYSLSYVVRINHSNDAIVIDMPNQQGGGTIDDPKHSVVIEIRNG